LSIFHKKIGKIFTIKLSYNMVKNLIKFYQKITYRLDREKRKGR
jgi:hypothetical protein